MTPFETIVRPILGDAYDTAFKPRFDAKRDRCVECNDARLTADEQHMAEMLSDLHVRAAMLGEEETRSKVRTALVSALKSLRLGAEARKRRATSLARYGPRYRFRVTAPDGTEIIYPSRGSEPIEWRYALIRRRIPIPADQIEAAIRAQYAPRFASCLSDRRTAEVQAGMARYIAREIEEQARPDRWSLWSYGEHAATLEREARLSNDPAALRHHEWLLVEGTPFAINT